MYCPQHTCNCFPRVNTENLSGYWSRILQLSEAGRPFWHPICQRCHSQRYEQRNIIGGAAASWKQAVVHNVTVEASKLSPRCQPAASSARHTQSTVAAARLSQAADAEQERARNERTDERTDEEQ